MPQPRQRKLWQQALQAMHPPSQEGSSLPPQARPCARHERLLLGWLHHGRGFLRVGLGLGLLGRRDDRALGNSFVIGGVDYGIARADGLTCLVGDAAAVLFLVAIVNDLAACSVWMMAPSISIVPIALPSALMARAKIAAVSPSAVTLLRTIEMVAGVMPRRSGRRCPGSCPYARG